VPKIDDVLALFMQIVRLKSCRTNPIGKNYVPGLQEKEKPFQGFGINYLSRKFFVQFLV